MAVFLLFAGLLLAATVAVLVFPLVRGRARRDTSRNALNASLYAEQLAELDADLQSGAIAATEYDSARKELKGRLLAEAGEAETPASLGRGRSAAIAVAFLVPVLAIAVYLAVGAPRAIVQKPPAADPAHELSPQQVEALVQRLAERLKSDPGNVEGWVLLGRSYGAFGRFKESADAYAQASKLRPGDAQLLADYADALGMALGRSLAGEPEKLIARALEADPRNLKALALAGTAAYDRKDFKGAAAFWERMLPLVDSASDDARSIRSNIEEARALAEGRTPQKPAIEAQAAAPAVTAPPITTPPAPAVAKGALNGEVKIAPALAAKAAPDDTVFIFARAAEGPPMPLAVLRKKVRDLPVSFALDDSMAMSPEMRLSAFEKVVISARVSKSGNVAAKPGDFQGSSGPVASNAAGVSVLIDSVLP